jgi:folate-binding protein YgfZ
MTKFLFAPLSSRSVIALGGPDWRSFLQGLVTQDVDTLAEGELRFAGLLTPQGRLLYDLFVVGRVEGAWLDVAAEHRDAILQRLAMYRLRAKVELAPFDLSVSAVFPPEGGAPARLDGLFRDPRLPELGWRGYGAACPSNAQAADEAAYEVHRLDLGVPGPADWGSDRAYPIEADFDLLHGIDFKKGCFVGQETTSRMKRRGQVKSRMLPIVFDGPPPAPGSEVLAGSLRAGETLSGVDGRAMALLRLDRALGASLTVEGRPARAEPPGWLSEALGEEAA